MLRRVLQLHAISLFSNVSLQVFLLLTYFIVSTSPIALHLVERNSTRDLLLLKSSVVHNAKLTKDASSSLSSITAHLNIGYPNMLLSVNKGNEFVKLLKNSERKLLAAQVPLPLVSSITEFPNAINSKRQHNKSLESEVRISSRSTNEFLNAGTVNKTDHLSEHYLNTINVKDTGNISDNAHSSVLENIFSSSNTLNASDQSSITTSPLFDNSSSIVSISSDVLDTSFNSSNNSAIDTTVNDFISLPTTHPSRETTKIDSPSTDSQGKGMTSGAVAGVVIAVLVGGIILTGTVIYLLYQKCGKSNKLESKCPSDNCGYVDDTLRSSGYLNSHIELPKESSEEMTSLDNDSFLNSLESMTFQNYWADNTKNTKV